jgi:L-serine dehydratase
MESLRELYRIGVGPSASHAMGPRLAAERFRGRQPEAAGYRVTLYSSLALTGKGHGTDDSIRDALAPAPVEFVWKPKEELPHHPNGMIFEALDAAGAVVETWEVFSVGGGALEEPGVAPPPPIYSQTTMAEILDWCRAHEAAPWELVQATEGDAIWVHLAEVWSTMQAAVERGLKAEGQLPGGLKVNRKAPTHYGRARDLPEDRRRTALLSAYALAVSEENAAGGVVATSPTCGACGVMPGVLTWFRRRADVDDEDILRALATAGLVGNLCKTNASISGAEVGCQGEVGVACAMAAAAAAQLMGGSPAQIEYAAEMGLEHHLGLTCDPIAGLVQIPCIERNAVAASRAIDSAEYALLSDGNHKVSFDDVVLTMARTGRDMNQAYRETSIGGLAQVHAERNTCA